MTQSLPKAFGFDVFGTVVDWRSGVIRDVSRFLSDIGRPDVKADEFADGGAGATWKSWAPMADPAAFVTLDILHREMLDGTLDAYAIDQTTIAPSAIDDLNRAWHRLDAWPDAAAGIARLRSPAPAVTLSNGNVAMMVALSRRSGLHWDAVLGAEVSEAYKPDPRAYLRTAEVLGIAPGELCLVAAHHVDLAAARACGLLTAHVARPFEYGGAPAPDAAAAQDWEWSCRGIDELASMMGG